MTNRSRTNARKKSKKNARRTSSNSTSTTAPVAPASTRVDAPETDFARALALIERSQLLAQADAAAKELELVTGRAFFGHLAGRPVDPRITRRFERQSSGWRVPWSASDSLAAETAPTSASAAEASAPAATEQVPEQVLPRVPDDAPAGYVQLGPARSLR